MPLNLLIIGDERKNRRILNWGFTADSYHVRTANSRAAVGALLEEGAFHAACVDTKMQEDDPFTIMDYLRGNVPRLPIVALLADRDRRLLSNLKQYGVRAHLVSPFPIESLRATVDTHALREPAGLRRKREPAASVATGPAMFVAQDETAKRMLEVAVRAAASNVAILILGETGTGKNLLAQTIHDRSPLRAKPFITVNCPSLNQELLESDLFGHVRGAFTGAVQDTWGKVAAAEGGTLFLDEIGDLPSSLQPKLLRLLQEKQYERVGESSPRTANVRIIAATNRELKAEVAAGHFREDLYYRLNVITIEAPPLRHRACDVVAAAEVFLEAICRQLNKRCPTFTPEARRLLENYRWPGNLRELRNVVERAAVLSDAATLDLGDFPALLNDVSPPRYQVGSAISLEAIENAHIQMVVAKSRSLEEAARVLQIDKSTLYRKRRAMEARVEKFSPMSEEVVAASS
jgi:two-component system, NtrC family, response regulator AlgB